MVFINSRVLARLFVKASVISIEGRKSPVRAATAAFCVMELAPLVNCP